MPIAPNDLPFWQFLRTERASTEEVLGLLRELADGARDFELRATWNTGHEVTVRSDEDLDSISDPGNLDWIRAYSFYTDDSYASIDLGVMSYVSGDRGEAVARARSIAAKWDSLPKRVQPTRLVVWSLIALIFLSSISAEVVVLLNIDLSSVLVVAGLVIAVAVLPTALSYWLHATTISKYARRVEITSAPSDVWFRDWRSVTPIVVSVCALVVNIIIAVKT